MQQLKKKAKIEEQKEKEIEDKREEPHLVDVALLKILDQELQK
jgi:hypothetical protein